MSARPANELWLRLNVANGAWSVELLWTTTPAPQSRAVMTPLLLKTLETPSMDRHPSMVLLNASSPSSRTPDPRIRMEVEPVLSTVSPSIRATELKTMTPRMEELNTLMLWRTTLAP